jgi:Tol biopolymer transport system component
VFHFSTAICFIFRPPFTSFRAVEGIFRRGAAPQYAVSDSGSLIYIAGSSTISKRTLVWVDRNGKEEIIEAEPGDYLDPRISPDGTQLALETSGDIWIWDMLRKNLRRLTLDGPSNYAPVWTPDGKRIIFGSVRGANSGIYWKAADGAGESEQLCSSSGLRLTPSSLSHDGKILLLVESSPTGTKMGISTLSMEGGRERKNLLQDNHARRQPQISPDGRLMAYVSWESGNQEVYVCPYPNVNEAKRQVSKSSGVSPIWSPDSRELFYQGGDAVMVVAVETSPIISIGSPKTLFDFVSGSSGIICDISPDGKRFLMMKEPKSYVEAPRKISVVINWFEELKQRVPVK